MYMYFREYRFELLVFGIILAFALMFGSNVADAMSISLNVLALGLLIALQSIVIKMNYLTEDERDRIFFILIVPFGIIWLFALGLLATKNQNAGDFFALNTSFVWCFFLAKVFMELRLTLLRLKEDFQRVKQFKESRSK